MTVSKRNSNMEAVIEIYLVSLKGSIDAATKEQKFDSDYCTLYQTASRAYELGVMLQLERGYHNKKGC